MSGVAGAGGLSKMKFVSSVEKAPAGDQINGSAQEVMGTGNGSGSGRPSGYLKSGKVLESKL
jgi:hypothetical protein